MSVEAVVFQTEFSGILTGNLGRSYIYAKPVTEVIPRFRISLLLGLTGIILSYLIWHTSGHQKAMTHGSAFDFASKRGSIFIAYSNTRMGIGRRASSVTWGGSFFDVFPLCESAFTQREVGSMSFFEKYSIVHWMILPIIAWSISSFATLTVL